MKTLSRLKFLAALGLAGGALAADPLDFPDASFRIKIGAQSTVTPASSGGSEARMGDRAVRVGERMSNAVRVNWIVSSSPEIGDEYVFIVRRAKEKPRTYSVVFKGGYTSVVEQEGFLIEIED